LNIARFECQYCKKYTYFMTSATELMIVKSIHGKHVVSLGGRDFICEHCGSDLDLRYAESV